LRWCTQQSARSTNNLNTCSAGATCFPVHLTCCAAAPTAAHTAAPTAASRCPSQCCCLNHPLLLPPAVLPPCVVGHLLVPFTMLFQPSVIVAAVVCIHAGLVLTPFALVHLAASWGQLSSIALDITAAGSAGGDPLQLVAGLASLTSLRDLSLRLAGGQLKGWGTTLQHTITHWPGWHVGSSSASSRLQAAARLSCISGMCYVVRGASKECQHNKPFCEPSSDWPHVCMICTADDCDATGSDMSSEGLASSSAAAAARHGPPPANSAGQAQQQQQQPHTPRTCWASLPCSLQSVSLHGFVLEPGAVRDLGSAIPQLR
jgi:hypothetical protein